MKEMSLKSLAETANRWGLSNIKRQVIPESWGGIEESSFKGPGASMGVG